MLLTATAYVLLSLAILPFIYYLLALYSSFRLFRRERVRDEGDLSAQRPLSGPYPADALNRAQRPPDGLWAADALNRAQRPPNGLWALNRAQRPPNGLWALNRAQRPPNGLCAQFTPPVSILKPVRGIDPDAYENFASFCRQDYPEYEVLFCVGTDDEKAIAAIEKLKRDFPDAQIRLLYGPRRRAVNDKVAKLGRLVAEAKYEHLAISDSDVRVRPDYLRSVLAPLADPKVGGVTCFYGSIQDDTFADRLQTVGMFSDFYAGIIVARQVDGVKFALGQTIVTTRSLIAGLGGYQPLENRPGDDLLVGRGIAEQGYEVKLLPYTVGTVSDYKSIWELLQKRLRWIVVMRHMRPWGHLGLLLTQGLPWSIAAVAVHPTMGTAIGYFGAYCALRMAMTWTIGVWGLRRAGLLREAMLIPAWDAIAFLLWAASFLRNSVRWRGGDYYIRDGMLVPATSASGD